GRFTSGRNRTMSLEKAVYFVTTADLNADGRLEIVADENEHLTVLLQGESTECSSADRYAIGGNAGEAGDPMKVADLNGDGDLDLVSSDGLTEGGGSVVFDQSGGPVV